MSNRDDHHRRQWRNSYNMLVRYVDEHNKMPPYGYKNAADGYLLGKWVVEQRQRFKKCTIDPDERWMLERVRGWSWNPHEDQWDEAIQELIGYIKAYKRLPKQSYVSPTGLKLGGWMRNKRRKYLEGQLAEKYVRQLDAIPEWRWCGLKNGKKGEENE